MVEFKTTISKITHYSAPENGDTRVFECSLPDGVNFPFISGQFAMIAHEEVKLLANTSQLKWASYSISSSPEQKNMLEFCIGGGSPTGVTHKLMYSREGEPIFIRGAFGNFRLKEDAPEYIFLATGTGIAPLISMIRTLLIKGKTVPITLFYGFRYPGQFMYEGELEQLQKNHPNFKVYPIASRPENHWVHATGHIQDYLKDFQPRDKQSVQIYICGKPQIGDELVSFCSETCLFPKENIHIEKW